MKRMLINVVEAEEIRVAIVEDGELQEYHVQEIPKRCLLGNIYLGRVVNVEPAIQAAFVDIGESRSAFLHVSDVHHAYQGDKGIPFERFSERTPDGQGKVLLQDLLANGQQMLVQVSKEAIGHKGPSVTTFLSLPGRYLVLMAGMGRSGVSKKIEDPEVRERLRDIAESLPVSDSMGVIVRTAGAGQPKRDLERDLRYLMQVWQEVKQRVGESSPPALLYEESHLAIRTVRDFFDSQIEKILVDSREVADNVRAFLKKVMPRYCSRVEFYDGGSPLFYRFNIEKEIESIYDRKVPLPSGGSLVIDETEALVAIDVNSGSCRSENDLERTALITDLEAAREIARQLRLRDIGGVIICDFIDVVEAKNRRAVELELREQLKHDRSRTWFSRFSRFGIIEMTRQRLRPSKDRVGREICPACRGRGTVRSARSLAISIFRQLKRSLGEKPRREAVVTVGSAILEILVNQKRQALVELEKQLGKRITGRSDVSFGRDQYTIHYH